MKQLFKEVVLVLTGIAAFAAEPAIAVPTRDEIYRSDRLRTVIFKDAQDPDVYWYLPPVKLFEADGKVLHYRRQAGEKVDHFFYIQPFMNDDLIKLLAKEVPGLQDRSQLKPVIARQFGMQVKQFNAVAMGDKITDFHYINQPQLLKISIDAKDSEEFDFFLSNKPGIQANVLFDYESERVDKYLDIQLSHKEVYTALKIGATGQYRFSRAQIERGVVDILSTKNLSIRSKGDISIPEIVNKVIEECFTPYQKKDEPRYDRLPWWDRDVSRVSAEDQSKALAIVSEQIALLEGLEGVGFPGNPTGDAPSNGSDGESSAPRGGAAVEFVFKRELANSEKIFYFSQKHLVESAEIASVPVYLSTLPSDVKTRVKVLPLPRHELIVESTHSERKPLRTGIVVGPDEQYDVNAVFAFSAKSAYSSNDLRWYQWSSSWPNPDEELYFRVGQGPWNRVKRHAAIKIEGINTGELEFYFDRKKLWEKIPASFKQSKLPKVVPPIFEYQKTYPQFNVVVTGRKVEIGP